MPHLEHIKTVVTSALFFTVSHRLLIWELTLCMTCIVINRTPERPRIFYGTRSIINTSACVIKINLKLGKTLLTTVLLNALRENTVIFCQCNMKYA